MVAIQHLPPRPRAVLILRDVLGWRASETAELLDTTVASVNCALQRARAGLKEHLPARAQRVGGGDASAARARAASQRYIEASEAGDAQALAALMDEDARFSMPPEPGLYVGRDTIVDFWVEGGFGDPEASASSAACSPAPTASPRSPTTSASRARTRSRRWRSTCCASRTGDRRDHRVRIPVPSRPSACRRRAVRMADRTTQVCPRRQLTHLLAARMDPASVS